MRVITLVRIAALTAFSLPMMGLSAQAAGADRESMCQQKLARFMDEAVASPLCRAWTDATPACVEAAHDHDLRGEQIAVACHEAEPETPDCIEGAWLNGHRGYEIVVACHARTARREAIPTKAKFLAPTVGVETAYLDRCDGHIDVTRDPVGRLELNFSVLDGCDKAELWDVEGVRRFTGRVEVGAGAMRRTGSWTVPSRIVNAAGVGMKVVLLDGKQVREVVYVSLQE